MAKIGVLGAGTWGMALTRMLANEGHETMVWSALEQEVDTYSSTRRQPNLPGMVIPDSVLFTKDIAEVCKGKDIFIRDLVWAAFRVIKKIIKCRQNLVEFEELKIIILGQSGRRETAIK